jgi:DNA mismatch endonuclease (patch repair protein)
MSRVRTRDTEPELRLRKELSSRGVRYRLHRKDLPGKPDIFIGRLCLAIFVNGCFWHGHGCPRGKKPSTNAVFWDEKIERNKRRDLAVIELLAQKQIEALTVWTCTAKSFDVLATEIAAKYEAAIKCRIESLI